MIWAILATMGTADADVTEATSGKYRLTDSPAQVQQFKEAAVKKTLDSMNFAVRAMAGSRVEAAVTACAAYDITISGDTMTVKCDAKPTVTVNLNGTPSSYTNDQGVAYTVTASRSGDQVTATFTGDDASQVTVYNFNDAGLRVQKTINSPYFGEPLRWTNNYRK